MNPVHVKDLLLVTQGKPVNSSVLPNKVNTISFDSRTTQSNDIFWALRGSNFDGHNFVTQALAKGAAACIVDSRYRQRPTPDEQRLIFVEDTLTALQKFAKWYRTQHQVTTIGITGSYGKTTTRELLYSVLSTKREGLRNHENQNNEFGVPFNLLKLTPQDQFLIMEMGAGKPNDIAPLTEITAPQIGIITGIGPAHLKGFRDIHQIIETKSELLKGLPANGMAVIPGDKPWTECLRKNITCQVITFGTQHNNQHQATRIRSFNNQLEFKTKQSKYQLSVIGQHHISTALSVIAVATELGYTPEEIQKGFDKFQPVAGRSRLVQTHPWTVIDDTYNANPVSCKASCQTLANWNTSGKRFLILGDMLELGQDTKTYHEDIGREAINRQFDYVFTYGENAKYIVMEILKNRSANTMAQAFDSQTELTEAIRHYIRPNDVVLVKGSRGMRMENIVSNITQTKVNEYTAIAG